MQQSFPRLGRIVLHLISCLLAASGSPSPAQPQAQPPIRSATEDQLRAAFLFQLAQYVTWPQSKPGESLHFCVLGDNELAAHMELALRGKTVQGRTVSISKVIQNELAATGCHVAYLAGSRRRIQDLLGRWQYPPTLLVGDAEGFARRGGMVSIRIESGRMSMEINLETCRRAGLDLRSQLLRLARIVTTEGSLQ